MFDEFKVIIEKIVGSPVTLFEETNKFGTTFSLINNVTGERIAEFALRNMPGCYAIGISHGVKVFDPYRNKGINTLLNAYKVKFAKEKKMSCLVCTVVSTNAPQLRVMEKCGWVKQFEFVYEKTGNTIFHFKKDL